MTTGLRQAIRVMLDGHNTLTVATCHDGRPWAATVFFASDAELNLFFVSDSGTQHARDMLVNDRVMAAVNADPRHWHEVRGLQIRGRSTRVQDSDRPAALAVFLAKFADIRKLYELARSSDERAIARRLAETDFFRITPDWIRLIDSSGGFGHAQELEL